MGPSGARMCGICSLSSSVKGRVVLGFARGAIEEFLVLF